MAGGARDRVGPFSLPSTDWNVGIVGSYWIESVQPVGSGAAAAPAGSAASAIAAPARASACRKLMRGTSST